MNQREMLNEIVAMMSDWEFVKECLSIKLAPKSDEPSIKRTFLDLEQSIGIYLPEQGVWARYTQGGLKALGKTEDEIFAIARKNLLKYVRYIAIGIDIPMIVITNDNMHNGAGVMCSVDILDRACEILSDSKIYILPSSKHEIICIAYIDDPEYLNEMIHDVNEKEVDEHDFLSDHYYVYDSTLKKIYF